MWNWTSSIWNSFVYCFMMEFFGFVNISTKLFKSNPFVVVITGKRPTNSGIIPYSTKSFGIAWSKYLPWTFTLVSILIFFIFALKPILAASIRRLIMCSNPLNAPPAMNNIFVVSICKKSPRGFLRPGSCTWKSSMVLVEVNVKRISCQTSMAIGNGK